MRDSKNMITYIIAPSISYNATVVDCQHVTHTYVTDTPASQILILLSQTLLDFKLPQVGSFQELFSFDKAVFAAVVYLKFLFDTLVGLERLPVELRLLLSTSTIHQSILTHSC